MGGSIDMELKGCELIIHDYDHDFWSTMVRWVDVWDSYRGDFRRRRAVDISSFTEFDSNHTEIYSYYHLDGLAYGRGSLNKSLLYWFSEQRQLLRNLIFHVI